MNTYFALVHQEGDSAFGISFPDLIGCFSASDDEAGIYQQAQEALALYAEDQDELPEARSIGELRTDPEVAAELAEGAFLIGVPLVMSSRKMRYNVVLETSLVRSVDQAAKVVGISRSEFISRAAGQSLRETVGAVILSDTRRAAAYSGSRKPGSFITSSESTGTKSAASAAKVMKDPKASKDAKSAAASALTQKAAKKK